MNSPTFVNGHCFALDMGFALDSKGCPVVSVQVLGRDGVWWGFPMVLDTGAECTLMPEEDAHALGIATVSEGHAGEVMITTATGESVTGFLHHVTLRIPGTPFYMEADVAFYRQASRLLGIPDLTREFVAAFDSHATHLLRD